MLSELLIRAAWALLITGFLITGYWLVNRVLLARLRRKPLGLEHLRPGVPAILYFTTPDCIPCKTMQRPALARLQENLGEAVQLIEVDAADRPEMADYWGVLSVPTTFIIDAHGQARRVNHGVASADKLKSQIQEVSSRRTAFSRLKKIYLRSQTKRNYS